LPDLRDRIRDPGCELCPLHEDASFVCLMGDGPVQTDIMVVGEAPGQREDESHQAFVGAAGKLLNQVLKEVGLRRKDLYITNAAKCRPQGNRTPDRDEVRTCVDAYLMKEIKMVSPKYILLLGNVALQGVAGRSGIGKHRGATFKVRGTKSKTKGQMELGEVDEMPTVYATYHPAAILRNPGLRDALVSDLDRFARMTRGEETSPQTTTKLVLKPAHLKWLRTHLMKATHISYDVETHCLKEDATNFEDWHDDESVIASIAFTTEAGTSYCVPLWHQATPWNPQTVLDYLKPAMERPDAKYIAHNGKFDCRWLMSKGIKVPQTFDTMLAAHMLDENRSKGLKPLSQVLLGADAYDIGEELADAPWVPLKRLAVYNGKDTDYTLRLYNVFREQLIKEPRSARVFKLLMMPGSNALTEIEREGIWIDNDKLDAMTIEAERELAKARKKLLRYVPPEKREDINFNSPQQVGEWLFGDLGLDILEETKSGAPSTNESVLLRLAKLHDGPKALLDYRLWHKRITTYLGPWKIHQDAKCRIHSTYKLYGTVTGRLSSVKPNLQQVPRDSGMRNIFGAPPGWSLVEADYSQIELRIAAHLAHETTMLRMFAAGQDIHLNTAVSVSGKLPEDITKEERKKAKAVNFGFLYGMGEAKFVTYALDNYDVVVTEEEAHEAREKFFKTYPMLRPWHERQRRLARRYHQVASPFGRIRHLSDIESRDREVRAEAERQAINSPVQSTASDLMLMSLIGLHGQLPREKAFIVGTVHDALLFQVRTNSLNRYLPVIHKTMINPGYKKKFGAEFNVPIEVEIKAGKTWGDPEAITWEPSSAK
jgi:uracil-DNA glycosylase family 4